MQQWFELSYLTMEESLYDVASMRRFGGLSLTQDGVPDETTILNFRYLLEENSLAALLLTEVNALLSESGLLLRQGTIVDATIISAPFSTKNESGKRDPEMHQTKKGNQWHFGMKAHIGVDAVSGVVHTFTGTVAYVHDVTQTHDLLHGEETAAFGDSAYFVADKRGGSLGRNLTWYVAMKRSKRKAISRGPIKNTIECLEKLKASVRARVEHQFRVVKQQFGYTKVRYRVLLKNTAQLMTLFALSNLWMVQRQLLTSIEEMRP